jgi:alkaline phosphatase D
MTVLDRRRLIASVGAGGALATFPAPALAQGLPRGTFTHSVASGDPTADAVILWTRFVPADGRDAVLGWEVATDEGFRRVVRRGRGDLRASNDWCVKVDARGLPASGRFFYRFLSGSGPSETGRTLTVPARGGDRLGLAVFSCSNLPFGWFEAYGLAAAREDIDLAVHTGDYIYEYERGRYPSTEEALAVRLESQFPPGETISLSDYHLRYQSYRADPDLQALHRLKPMIAVWDDHEIANDAWTDGAQEHDAATEGTWIARRTAAVKAWFDWMPARGFTDSPLRIYRTFRWGDLATLNALDTRLIGRTPQFDSADAMRAAVAAGDADRIGREADTIRRALADPSRSLLGRLQEAWIADELRASTGAGVRWQVLVQQLVMSGRLSPPESERFVAPDASAFNQRRAVFNARMGQFGLPGWFDSWSGHPAARERLLQAARQASAATVVLSGDSHNAWRGNLRTEDGAHVGVEVAGTSVSSPGLERGWASVPAEERRRAMVAFNPELDWVDLDRRGYAVATLTRDACVGEWVGLNDVRTRGAGVAFTERAVSQRTRAGAAPWARL